MIGHLDLTHGAAPVPPSRHGDLGHGRHALERPEPAQHGLVPDAHVQDVVAAQRDVLPPVQRLLALHEAPALRGLQLHGEHLADVALAQERLQGRVDLEGGWRGYELGDQVGRPSRGFEHLPPLGGVHGHARLAEDVLALLEGGQGDLAVHVGPGSDADRVDVLGLHDLPPVSLHPADAELPGDALARFLAAVGHGHQLDAGLRLELRNVMELGVLARPHETHTDRSVGHDGILTRGSPAPRRRTSA